MGWPNATPTLSGVDLPGLRVAEIDVPSLEKTGGGTGWGSRILVRPDPTAVYWTRSYGLSPMPWSRFDVSTGELTTVKGRRGLHGEIRDYLLEPDGRHAWVLLTGGLALVDLEAMEEVALVRAGLPKYLWRLHRLSDSLLAAGAGRVNGVTVIDVHRKEVIRTLRIPPPDIVVRTSDEIVHFVSFSAGEYRELDLRSLQSKRRQPVTLGIGAQETDGGVWLFQGTRRVDPRMERLRIIEPEKLARFDLKSLQIDLQDDGYLGGRDVLGVDGDGRLVFTSWYGVHILDTRTFEIAGELRMLGPNGEPSDFWTAALLPDQRSVACLPNAIGGPERLLILSW